MRQNNLIMNKTRSTLVLAVPVLLALVVVVFPILQMLRISFCEVSPVSAYGSGFTFDNYIKLLTDPFYLKVLGRTLIVGLGTGVFCTIVGYPVAFHMSKISAKKQQLITMLIMAPLYTSIIIRCYAWMVILGNKGILNSFLTALGLSPMELMYNYFSVYVGLVYVFLAYMITNIYNVLVTIDPKVEEASMIMGASPARTFIEVTLPMSLQGVFSGFLLVFVLSMGAYVVPQVLGGTKMGLIPNHIYTMVIEAFNWTQGSALAFIYVILVVVVLMAYFKIVSWFSRYLTGNGGKNK